MSVVFKVVFKHWRNLTQKMEQIYSLLLQGLKIETRDGVTAGRFQLGAMQSVLLERPTQPYLDLRRAELDQGGQIGLSSKNSGRGRSVLGSRAGMTVEQLVRALGTSGCQPRRESGAERDLIGRPSKEGRGERLVQGMPPLPGLLPKSTISRQLEALSTALLAGCPSSLSSLSTLTSSLTSQESPWRDRNHVLSARSPQLGTKAQGHLLGGIEVYWGLKRCQIPGMDSRLGSSYGWRFHQDPSKECQSYLFEMHIITEEKR